MQQQESHQQSSVYSSDEEYFLDVCRAGQMEELQQFLKEIEANSTFDFQCVSNSFDNFIHMLAANNLIEMFEYLYPIVEAKLGKQKMVDMLNHQNSTKNTPLHYAVITDSKEMVKKLLEMKVDAQKLNEFGRTALDEAQQFGKQEIAEMLAVVTKLDVQKLKSEMAGIQICNEADSDEEDQDQEEKQEKYEKEEKIEKQSKTEEKTQEQQSKTEEQPPKDK